MKKTGTIVTFYSFKGGVGRTMCLANIAVLLAGKYRVLIIDFDLEAPGLDNFFSTFKIKPGSNHGGLLEILELSYDKKSFKDINYQSFIQSITGPSIKSLHFLSSGNHEVDYSFRVQNFNWLNFFEKRNGSEFFENLRNEIKMNYDFILLDSRTGYSDTSGICTYFLPDILLLLFTANEQSVKGAMEVADKAQAARQKMTYDRMPLTVLPVPSRIDKTEEYEETKKWNDVFIDSFSQYYKYILPEDLSPGRLLEEITVPYLAYYSFGEKLSVLKDSHTSKSSPAYYYSQIAKILENSSLYFEKPLLSDNSDEKGIEETKLKIFWKTFRTTLNNRQLAIVKEVQDNGLVTNRWCRVTFRVVNDTVNRDLNSMVELKILKREGKGRATRYIAGEKLMQ